MPSKHDRVANKIAAREGADYNRGPGPDVVTRRRAIEIETKDTVTDGLRQLRGFRRPVFIAGADAEAVKAALDTARGTTVGVMDDKGNVLRRSTRKPGRSKR